MRTVSKQRMFDALSTLSRALAEGGVPNMQGTDAVAEEGADAPFLAIAAMDSAPSPRVAGMAGRSRP
ncbi:hypothetical protein JMJ56_25435 [Belnapia sp. T18]|uniref:Uncharacterized protein n=1 Tax=Belnapia arida TaxID=2804533 RepID=A0ABS1U9H9_9PROT|nr:hypothetical protein [Belnapia arida]MBL6081343.1 hypothetical protein [Belnapia arida]